MRCVPVERAPERERDPEGDRQIEVQYAAANPLPGGAEEHRAADEDARERDRQVPALKERVRRAVVQSGVGRDREDHRVHRQRDADAHADDEAARAGLRLLERRPEEVPEALHLADEAAEIELALREDLRAPERRVHRDPGRARGATEEGLDQPHTRAAMDPLQIEIDARHVSARSARLVDGVEPPRVATLAPGLGHGDAALAAQIVIATEVLRGEQAVDSSAARAAERAGSVGGERVPTVKTPGVGAHR